MDMIVEQLLRVKPGTQEDLVTKFQEEMCRRAKRCVEKRIEQLMEDEVDRWLGRRAYQRRNQRSGRRVSIACPKCSSNYPRDWLRNGHRPRCPLTMYRSIKVWLPRVKCKCGGSVPIPFEILTRRQRIWKDIELQVQQWATMNASLRKMQSELALSLGTMVGLSTINVCIQRAGKLRIGTRSLSTVPPVVLLDAIWVSRLVDTGTTKVDRAGRRRPVKCKKRGAVLVAVGVWPNSGRYHVLDWELADGESRADWEELLARLIERQLWPTRGLRLFVHDGGAGLKAALRRWYSEVPSQRCVFHKLRNVCRDIVVPEGYSSSQRRALKRKLAGQAAKVFKAVDLQEAESLLSEFKDTWSESQPAAVETLFRDQEDTLRFYSFLARNPSWQAKAIRTTSSLERVNRSLRKPFRAAGAYHSATGIQNAVRRVLTPLLIL